MEKLTIHAVLIGKTPKAYMLRTELSHFTESFPKSLVTYNGDLCKLTAPKWLLKKKYPNHKF